MTKRILQSSSSDSNEGAADREPIAPAQQPQTVNVPPQTVPNTEEGNKRHKTMKQTSKYKGVSYVLKDKKWKAQIMIEKMKYNIGNFSNELDAVRAYDEIAKELSNKQLHFPESHPEHVYKEASGYDPEQVAKAIQMISGGRKQKTYKYTGAYLEKKKWTSQIKLGKQQFRLGSYDNEIDAAKAYDVIAKELTNKKLNFPEDYVEHVYQPGPYIEHEVEAAKNLVASVRKKYVPESASAYHGVNSEVRSNKYVAQIKLEGKSVHIGRFTSEIEAAKAYDKVASKVTSKALNFPDEYPEHKQVSGSKDTPNQIEAAQLIIDAGRKRARKESHPSISIEVAVPVLTFPPPPQPDAPTLPTSV